MTTSGSAAYQIDETQKLITTPDGRPVRLAPRSFSLLAFLHHHPGQLFTCIELLQNVWGSEVYDDDLVRVTIQGIRQKLGKEAVDSVRWYGYGIGIAHPEVQP